MPALFGAAAPDYKDAPSAVDIAGAESPLYLESEADIRLPPWDVIDAHAALDGYRVVFSPLMLTLEEAGRLDNFNIK